jgi:hypothetical protein
MIRRRIVVLVLALAALFTRAAFAEVTRTGEWPETDPEVTLSLSNQPRTDALKRLAEAAKWSIVVDIPTGNPVDIHVKKQPAQKVLELLLQDGHYVAKRDGDLISIQKAPDSVSPADAGVAATPEPPPPPPPSPPAVASAPTPAPAGSRAIDVRRGEDLFVTGGSTRVEKDQVVHDLVVMGGSAEVYGRVTGDVAVMGGSATIKSGAKVEGDLAAIGGSIDVEEGATVEGDVGTVGGRVRRDGKDTGGGIQLGKGELAAASVGSVLRDVGGAITRSALLFVFGAVLLALATRRMDAMQGEVATRPMRSFALGVVGVLVALVAFVALCITLIGIPIAVCGLLLAIVGAYAGICAVLTTVGAALVRHRSKSPYVHLAVGCVAFLLLGAIPFLGGFVTFAVVLIGFGSMVATRGAGVFAKKDTNGPYRTAAA